MVGVELTALAEFWLMGLEHIHVCLLEAQNYTAMPVNAIYGLNIIPNMLRKLYSD